MKKKIIITTIIILSIFQFSAYPTYALNNIDKTNSQNSLDFVQWEENDKKQVNYLIKLYMEGKRSKTSLIKELFIQNDFIISDISIMKKSYIKTQSGALLYNKDVTGQICVLYHAFESRNKLIEMINNEENLSGFEYDYSEFTEGRNMYDRKEIISLLDLDNVENNYKVTFDILNSEKFPTGFLKNIEVYISPYELLGVNGYSYSTGIKGREEYVVIAYTSKDILDSVDGTVYHELGHIFEKDVAGILNDSETYGIMYSNSNVWDEYKKIYPEFNSLNTTWFGSISENFAEDFKMYMAEKNNKFMIKLTNYTFDKNRVIPFFDNLFKTYNAKSQKVFPTLNIKIKEYSNILSYETSENNVIYQTSSGLFINVDDTSSLFRDFSLYIVNQDTNELYCDNMLLTERVHIDFSKNGLYNIMICLDTPTGKVCVGTIKINKF